MRTVTVAVLKGMMTTFPHLSFQCIYLKFEHFDVDCFGDSVDIYEKPHLINQICGTTSPTIYLSGANVIVQFVSNSITEGTGFQLTWQQTGGCWKGYHEFGLNMRYMPC